MELANRIKAKLDHWIRRKPQIHILSDSHGEAFKFVDWTKFEQRPYFCIVQGATASGLANPNSKTKALPIFINYINKRIKKFDNIIFQLGEIDCGFTIWLKAQKKSLTIEEQLNKTITNYTSLLEKAQKSISNPIIVTSAVLPTIEDGQDFGAIANLRKDVKANQLERTKLTIQFNKTIKAISEKKNYIFVDLDKSLLDPETKLVKKQFKNPDKLDHHLHPEKFASLLSNELLNILK